MLFESFNDIYDNIKNIVVSLKTILYDSRTDLSQGQFFSGRVFSRMALCDIIHLQELNAVPFPLQNGISFCRLRNRTAFF